MISLELVSCFQCLPVPSHPSREALSGSCLTPFQDFPLPSGKVQAPSDGLERVLNPGASAPSLALPCTPHLLKEALLFSLLFLLLL